MKSPSVEQTPEQPTMRGVGSSDSSAVCDCWTKTDALLREKGFKISDACSAFVLTQTTIDARHYLPIQRADGGKRKMSDPKGIAISHCPFCGRSLLPNTADDTQP